MRSPPSRASVLVLLGLTWGSLFFGVSHARLLGATPFFLALTAMQGACLVFAWAVVSSLVARTSLVAGRLLWCLGFVFPFWFVLDGMMFRLTRRHVTDAVLALTDANLSANAKFLSAVGLSNTALVGLLLAGILCPVGGYFVERHTRHRGPSMLRTLLFTVVTVGAVHGGSAFGISRFGQPLWEDYVAHLPVFLSWVRPPSEGKMALTVRLRRSAPRRVAPKESAPPQRDAMLFVIDSLRLDALHPDVMPTLTELRKGAWVFDDPVSASNCTHLSWYGLFFAEPPFAWGERRRDPQADGAPMLSLARAAGYRLEVLATSDIALMDLDKTLFGKEHHAVDAIWESKMLASGHGNQDARTMEELARRLATSHPPTFYFVFLESPHFDYAWADNFVPPHVPYLQQFPFPRVNYAAEEVALARARYKNSVSFVDSLFRTLAQRPEFARAVVGVVGDHAEEIMEHGLLGHGSELCHVQTRTPMFVHAGDGGGNVPLGSLLDVLPTMMNALGIAYDDPAPAAGHPVQNQGRRVAVTLQMNQWRDAARFALTDGTLTATFRFEKPEKRYERQSLFLVELRTREDEPFCETCSTPGFEKIVSERFQPALSELFELYP